MMLPQSRASSALHWRPARRWRRPQSCFVAQNDPRDGVPDRLVGRAAAPEPGRHRRDRPERLADGARAWAWDGERWKEGCSSLSWADHAIPAHVGRSPTRLHPGRARMRSRALIAQALGCGCPARFAAQRQPGGLNGRWRCRARPTRSGSRRSRRRSGGRQQRPGSVCENWALRAAHGQPASLVGQPLADDDRAGLDRHRVAPSSGKDRVRRSR